MIDIENIVIDTVATAVWADAEFADIDVTSDYDPTPDTFPCVFIEQLSNTAYQNSFDDANTDHHVNVMFQIDTFALDKETSKKLRDITDTAMQGMKFTRIYSAPTMNVDRTIKRYTSRYTAIVGELTNSKYQMYRS